MPGRRGRAAAAATSSAPPRTGSAHGARVQAGSGTTATVPRRRAWKSRAMASSNRDDCDSRPEAARCSTHSAASGRPVAPRPDVHRGRRCRARGRRCRSAPATARPSTRQRTARRALRESRLDRAQAGLRSPAAEVRPVVLESELEAQSAESATAVASASSGLFASLAAPGPAPSSAVLRAAVGHVVHELEVGHAGRVSLARPDFTIRV